MVRRLVTSLALLASISIVQSFLRNDRVSSSRELRVMWWSELSAAKYYKKGVPSPKARKLLKRLALDLEQEESQQPVWIVQAVRELSLAPQITERQRIAQSLRRRVIRECPIYHETAIQAMALAGQIDVALAQFDMRTAQNDTTYRAIAEGLRDAGRIAHLKDFLQQWNSETTVVPPSVRMFNILLNAQASLNEMYYELQHAFTTYGVEPDAISYSIVLQKAAKQGNRTMVDQVWGEMENANVKPRIECYNALLQLAQTPKEILFVWDTKLDPTVPPNSYTIDFVLVPMVKSGRMREVMRILDEFVATAHPHTVTNAFTPFLLKLARDGGEIDTAKSIWDTYTLDGRLTPNIRHFNVLLGCYQSILKDSVTPEATEKAYEDGWDLYRALTYTKPVIRPDVITLVEMMKFCRSSDQLSEFLLKNLVDYQLRVTGTVFRSAVTTYGKLGDPSSALWLFDRKSPDNLKSWNTLLGCLVKASTFEDVVKPSDSKLALLFKRKGIWDTSSLSESTSSMILNQSNLCTKVEETFATMLADKTVDSQTFCLMAMFLQRQGNPTAESAQKLYLDAIDLGVDPDGRFLNGVLRCFGRNLQEAIAVWKNQMRPHIMSFYENNDKDRLLNLSAAYFGMFYVCGRALRPDVALRLAYAMVKDGLEPDNRCLNTYRMGRREHGTISALKEKLLDIHESLFEVECSKSRNDWHRQEDRKVRVILSPQAEYIGPSEGG